MPRVEADRRRFALAAMLAAAAAVAVALAIAVAAGWVTAMMIAAAALLLAILAFGWYHAVSLPGRADSTTAEHQWLYFVLVAATVAAAPLVPVLVVKGMDHYAYAPVLRPLPFAPNDSVPATR